MINILKLRKLEKENRQRKLSEQSIETEQPAVSTEEIQSVEKKAPEEPKTKAVKTGKAVKKSGKKKTPDRVQEETVSGSESDLSEQPVEIENENTEPVPPEEEYNPVEIFRQNLLNELLNSDSLPEYTEPAHSSEEVIEADAAQFTEEEITPEEDLITEAELTSDEQYSSAEEESIIPETPVIEPEVTEQKYETPAEEVPEQLELVNKELEKSRESEKNKKGDSLVHLVSFSLGKENYGVDIMRIREIIRMVDITKVPKAPEFIEGVINLRGTVIPVINLRTRMKLPREEYNKFTRIIVLELKDTVIGFIVDEVKEVLRIPESVITPPPTLTVGKSVEYITAVAKLDNCLLILIEPEKLLSGNEISKLK